MFRNNFKDFILMDLSLSRNSSMYFRCKFLEFYIYAGKSTRMNYFDTQFCRHLSFGASTYEVPTRFQLTND